ncbi:MAG: hypothetical protein MPJ50_07865 [Pirellulales bacterium]|nr:hypothetical protein [Pirellulales bacterium]
MAIDLYSICPCGTGKKIKFCCRDLAPEIEKIERLLEADQRHACLEHIEQLEKKFPQRSYLEMRKASLLRQLGKAAEADSILKELVHRDASNPVVWAEAVFLVLDREDQEFRVAIELLQRAIDAAGDKTPREVLEAIALVSQYAHTLGMPLVCLKHMLLYLDRDPENQNAFVALLRFQQSPQVSALLKDTGALPSLAEGELPAEQARIFEAVAADASLGRIRPAERQLTELSEQAPKSPAVWKALGLVRGWLGDNPAAVDAFRRLSTLDIPFDDAVEAEALAQLLDEDESETIDIVELNFVTDDLDQARKQLEDSQHVHELSGEVTAAGDEPPPRSLALLLDRAMPKDAQSAPYEELPSVIARLAYFGKQVDRAARVGLIAHEDSLEEAKRRLLEISGGMLTEEPTSDDEQDPPRGRRVVGQVSVYAAQFAERKFLPEDTPADRRYDIIQDDRRHKLLEVWPQGKLPPLSGKTPSEAAKGTAEDRIRLAGMVLNMELTSQRETVSANSFDELRQQLELPAVHAPENTHVEDWSLVRLSRLDPTGLSDEDLLLAFTRAGTNRYPAAIVNLGQEVLSRPELISGENAISPEEVCGQIAELHEDTRLALEWNERAREFSLKAGVSNAGNDLFELYVRLNRGEADNAVELLQHLMDEHGDEPGVRNAVAKVLQETGLMNPDGTMARSKEPAIVTAGGESEAGKIWTPDEATATTGGTESKIWVPD